MRAIVPVDVFDGSLTSSSGLMRAFLQSSTYADNRLYSDPYGTTYAYFRSSTAYTAGQMVVGTGRKGIYKKLTASGASATAPESDPVNWQFVGSTYRWAVFDRSTSRSNLDSGNIVIGPFNTSGVMNRVMILDSTHDSIKIEGVRVTVPGGVATVLWTVNVAAASSGAVFNSDGGLRSQIITIPNVGYTFDALGYRDCVKITFNSAGAISEILMGYELDFGKTKKGYDTSITDYSKKTVDDYGQVTVVKRGFSSKMNISTYLDTDAQAELCVKNLKLFRSQLLGWSGDDSRPSTHVLGYCKDWTCRTDDAGQNLLQMSIEGVV